jgi:hypothetical protein
MNGNESYERLMRVERSKFKVLNDQSNISSMQIEDFSPFSDFSQSIFTNFLKYSH